MMAVAAILWHIDAIGAGSAFILTNSLNVIGYLKYIYQMYVDPEYITLSFHCYCLAWLAVSLVIQDPLYFVLFRYPFHLLGQIEQYMNMKGREILLDESSVTLHCVDHLIHGMICCRVLLYHFWGIQMVLLDLLTVPFCLLLSENLVRIQDPKQHHKLA